MLLFEIQIRVSAAQRCYGNASGLDRLGVRQRFSAVHLVCGSPSPHTTSNWQNQFGGKLQKKQDPSKIDNRYGVLHMSTGKTDVVALEPHPHLNTLTWTQ